jgi:hypothetical protein
MYFSSEYFKLIRTEFGELQDSSENFSTFFEQLLRPLRSIEDGAVPVKFTRQLSNQSMQVLKKVGSHSNTNTN